MIQFQEDTNLFQAVLKICRLIRQHGGRAVLVGGCVRDALQNNPCKDFDLECYNISAEKIQEILKDDFALDLVGMSFGVMKVHHFDIDIALPRRENKTGAGHRGFMVDCIPDLTFADAAARRDFTVNAMMYDPLDQEFIDPWNGKQDLEQKVLRHVSEHFSEDPLRVLRAMQFAARFDFTIAPETIALCRQIPGNELALDRIAAEWDKLLLKGKAISVGIDFLAQSQWLPEELKDIPTAPLNRIPGHRTGQEKEDRILALTVLCHTLTSAKINAFLEKTYRLNGLAETVTALTSHLPDLSSYQTKPDGALRRLALAVKNTDLLLRAAECCYPAQQQLWNELRKRAEDLQILHTPPTPLLQGRDLLQHGIKPGREMGQLLQTAFDAQLDGAFMNHTSALLWLKNKLK